MTLKQDQNPFIFNKDAAVSKYQHFLAKFGLYSCLLSTSKKCSKILL